MPTPSPGAAMAALRQRLPLLVLPTTLLVLGAAASSQGFPTAEPSPRLQAANQDVPIRVLLKQDDRLQVGAGSARLLISDARGGRLLELPPGEELQLTPGFSGLTIERIGAASMVLTPGLREVWIGPTPAAAADTVLRLGGKPFRGRLQVRLNGGQVQAINHLPLEDYLTSVVGSEMPATWPQAALQAQAVAARTYALARRRPADPFDLKATVASQVYRGVEGETASTREAVSRTRGQVLLYNNIPIEAVFHSSSSSGRTESSGELWAQQLPYLVSVPDFDNVSPVNSWRARFEPADLRRIFPETGGLQSLDVVNVSSSGRIRRVQIVGPRGAVMLSGADLRQRLGLRSTLVQLELIGAQPLASERGPLAGLMGPAASGEQGSGARGAAGGEVAGNPGPGVGGTPAAPALGSRPAARPGPLSATADWGPLPPSLPPLPMAGGASRRPIANQPQPPVLVVQGKGFGHGVGLSQWGAYGMALQGKNYEEILRHYYRGVDLKPYRASAF
ncbi:MAG: SpoIID/LytB domain-containing protein [Synechococcaceae cyanobacterium]